VIRDWLAGAAAVLMRGPLLFLLAAFLLLVGCGFAYGRGRRDGRRDQARWHVAQGIRWAVRHPGPKVVPGQRRGEP
jgi:hypothetical protein